MPWWNPFRREPKVELEPIPDTEKGRLLSQQIAQADAAYGQLYERGGAGAYSEMKESSHEAIRLARELGLARRAAALEAELAKRKATFRDQLS
jgi:hypothetical protein